jgi:glutamate receptor, ionotropic, invertebrate
MWWFFTLIMVSSYTANLAAFLTIESVSSPISNVEDLANADGAIPYGAKKGGSTFGFFKESDNPIYKKMYEYMVNHPEHMTSSNDEGLERAKAGRYAFLMESSSIEYIIERQCEVRQLGGELDAKGYGIAMKKSMCNEF